MLRATPTAKLLFHRDGTARTRTGRAPSRQPSAPASRGACTEAEALDIIETDKRIDRGEKLFELTKEQEKAAKQARQAPRAPTVYKFTQREKKAKPEKAQICSAMIQGVQNLGD